MGSIPTDGMGIEKRISQQATHKPCFNLMKFRSKPVAKYRKKEEKMHITEGIITGTSAAAYTGAGLTLTWYGIRKMKQFAADFPDKKPLLGMAGALIFFISLLPIPAFTGTCSHPCGTPFIAILFGPAIAIALTGGSLLLQAAFFAHGGFGTWGANVVALGFFGCLGGWCAFRLMREIGLPLWLAGFAGGLVGDILVYAASGMILAGELATASTPQYSLTGYLVVIYTAYLPTQLPIAIGEMVITGLALQYIFNQRPEVLIDLGLVGTQSGGHRKTAGVTILSICLMICLWAVPASDAIADTGQADTHQAKVLESETQGISFSGMDESVNETLAENAGLSPKDPYINIESMGDVWNAMLLIGGAVCGFIFGRWWHLISQVKTTGSNQLRSAPS